jgi:hypothetical protein
MSNKYYVSNVIIVYYFDIRERIFGAFLGGGNITEFFTLTFCFLVTDFHLTNGFTERITFVN